MCLADVEELRVNLHVYIYVDYQAMIRAHSMVYFGLVKGFEMGYEVFTRTGVRVESPTVSLVPDGRITINAAAVRILIQAGVKTVLLLWDKANNRMALKAASRADKSTYAVSIAPGSHSGSLRAKLFLVHIGWNAPNRQTLPAVWDEKEKMFEVSLPSQFLGSGKTVLARRTSKGGT